MTSLVIAEGWNMFGIGPRGARNRNGWREISAAWAVAGMLAGALLLSVPRHDTQDPPASLWSLSPAAGIHAHKGVPDPKDPTGDEACSDRDYANELC